MSKVMSLVRDAKNLRPVLTPEFMTVVIILRTTVIVGVQWMVAIITNNNSLPSHDCDLEIMYPCIHSLNNSFLFLFSGLYTVLGTGDLMLLKWALPFRVGV